MKRVLIDAQEDQWEPVIPHEDHEVSYGRFPLDTIRFVQLHAHKDDDRITVTVDGNTVGHFPADLAYFAEAVRRVENAGLSVFAEAQVNMIDGRRELFVPLVDKKTINRWAYRQLGHLRKHRAELRQLAKVGVTGLMGE